MSNKNNHVTVVAGMQGTDLVTMLRLRGSNPKEYFQKLATLATSNDKDDMQMYLNLLKAEAKSKKIAVAESIEFDVFKNKPIARVTAPIEGSNRIAFGPGKLKTLKWLFESGKVQEIEEYFNSYGK